MKPKMFKEIISVMKVVTSNYEKIMTNKAKELGLSFAEAHVLLFFYDNDSLINAKDIVFKDNVSKSFVSKAIKSLVDKKYIKIIVDEKDKRYQKIILNDNTKSVIKDLNTVRDKYRDFLVNNVTKDELCIFLKVLEKIETNIMLYDDRSKL